MRNRSLVVIAVLLVAATGVSIAARAQDGFRFRSGVELINVTATVADDDGRFVPGLRKDDFTVYENGKRQDVSHFSNERVPVSLGILLDASGSMTAEKMRAARSAIDRFIYDLLDKDDELFFAEFATTARITQEWTTDRRAISRAVGRVDPVGGTALYDAIAEALPVASAGHNRKKAILVISDGNDTNSRIWAGQVRQSIRESEVLVYALGIDTTERSTSGFPQPPVQVPFPIPFPVPGRRLPEPRLPPIVGGTVPRSSGERVNADALREITDDTGGRTEIVRRFGDLGIATARLADELSKQYYLGYTSTEEKDGRWHEIRVDVRNRRLTVRARRGYVAS